VLVVAAVVALIAAVFGTLALRWSRLAVAADADPQAAQVDLGLAAPTGVPAVAGSVDPAAGLGPQVEAPPIGPRFSAHTPVFLVGDSLAVGIADPLISALPGRAVTVEALEGRMTSTAVGLLADHAATTAPIWVVSLGTNDLPADFPTGARAMLRLAGPDRCVLWYDVYRTSTQDQINATLTQLARRHANLHLLGWEALAQANPGWFGPDGIHPAQEGYLARTMLATDAITSLCTTGF
jgi:hypothetical protein